MNFDDFDFEKDGIALKTYIEKIYKESVANAYLHTDMVSEYDSEMLDEVQTISRNGNQYIKKNTLNLSNNDDNLSTNRSKH